MVIWTHGNADASAIARRIVSGCAHPGADPADARTIAVVGASPHAHRTSNGVMRYLQRVGYRCIPVNPNAPDEVLGERCYPSLRDVPEPVDFVDVFRRAEYCEAVAEDGGRRRTSALAPARHPLADARRSPRRRAWTTSRTPARPSCTATSDARLPLAAPRGVAQPGSALRSGRRGPEFESRHPDYRAKGSRLSPGFLAARAMPLVGYGESAVSPPPARSRSSKSALESAEAVRCPGTSRRAGGQEGGGQADDVQVVAFDALDERCAAALDRVAAGAALPLAAGDVQRRDRAASACGT